MSLTENEIDRFDAKTSLVEIFLQPYQSTFLNFHSAVAILNVTFGLNQVGMLIMFSCTYMPWSELKTMGHSRSFDNLLCNYAVIVLKINLS